MNPDKRGKPPLPVPPPGTAAGERPSPATSTTHTAPGQRGNQNVPDSPQPSYESEGSAPSRVSVLATGTMVPSPRTREVHPALRQQTQSSSDMQVVLNPPGDHGGDRGGDNISESENSGNDPRNIRVTNLGSGQLEATEDKVQAVDYYNNYYQVAAAGSLPGGLETGMSSSFDQDMDYLDEQGDAETGDLLQLHNVSTGYPESGMLFSDAQGTRRDEAVPTMPTLTNERDIESNGMGNRGRRREGGGAAAATALSMQPLIAVGGPDAAGTQAANVAYTASRQAGRRNHDWRVYAVILLALAMIAAVVTTITLLSNDSGNGSSGIIGPEFPVMNGTITPSSSPSLTFNPSNEGSRAPSASPSLASVFPSSRKPTRTPSQTPFQTPSLTPSPTQSQSRNPSQNPSLTPLPTQSQSQNPSQTPSQPPSESPGISEVELLAILITASFDDGEALMDPGSPQSTAFEWLAGNANLNSYGMAQILQRYALATFYFSTNGSQWKDNLLWLSDEEECTWFSEIRAACEHRKREPGGTFRRLELYFNNVQGTIPPEIALLSDLERIDISGGPDHRLNGTLPKELGLLTKLNDFRLQDNDLSGSLPPEFGAWEGLDFIDLSNNRLNSTLPIEIGMWSDVRNLNIAGNRFSGTIGSQIGQLLALRILSLDDNLFTGALPTEIGMLDKLLTLSMNGNQLVSLPTEIARMQNLRFLSLESNSFSTTLPTELGQLNRLVSLSVKSNSFVGPIPSELGNLRALREKLDLSENEFSGSIPSELGRINGSLRMLFLRDNLLTGTIPAEMSRLDKVNVLTLDSNSLTGSMPLEACKVFNRTQPTIFIDCDEVSCPCCTYCCRDGEECECRYLDTDLEYLCFF
jgi:Leucine-rich repeat (LRR) protein